MYDTHCHPYLAKKKSQETILESFFESGWKYLNSIWIDIDSSLTSIQLAKQYEGIYATIGIHPTECLQYKDTPKEALQKLRDIYQENSEHVVAIGECWLDYHWLESLSEKHKVSQEEIIKIQKYFFRAQIKLAEELDLPLVIHNRNADEDVLDILIEEDFWDFVMHCFTSTKKFAWDILSHAPDCKLGFGGVTTFKNVPELQELVQEIPLHNIIIETDSPYLTPIPYRGVEENEPWYLKYILEKIIDLRAESEEEIEKTFMKSSRDFFRV